MLTVLISYTITPFLICLLKGRLGSNNLVLSFLRSGSLLDRYEKKLNWFNNLAFRSFDT